MVTASMSARVHSAGLAASRPLLKSPLDVFQDLWYMAAAFSSLRDWPGGVSMLRPAIVMMPVAGAGRYAPLERQVACKTRTTALAGVVGHESYPRVRRRIPAPGAAPQGAVPRHPDVGRTCRTVSRLRAVSPHR